MQRYEQAFVQLLGAATGLPETEFAPHVRTPEPEHGDVSFPCFPLAKALRKAPPFIAAELAAKMQGDPRFSTVAATGPYVNATVEPRHLAQEIVADVVLRDQRFCCSELGAGQTVLLEYSSPNIAKPLGFHHLRSTMIGNALARLHRALGYDVKSINFLGDWGKTFGLLAEAFQHFGEPERLEHGGIAYLLELYVKANAAAKADPGFDEAARAMFRKQEEGDTAAFALWQHIRSISLREFERIYARLGVRFDFVEGESCYRFGMDAVIERITQTAGTRIDQGALVVDMPYGAEEAPMMIKKSDGATLYATRDIAAAIDRFERFHFAKSLYIVGGEQKRHFDQLKRALAAMGCDWHERMAHVSFGRIQGMSTRKGNVVFLEEVLDEAVERARTKMQEAETERGFDLDEVSEMVGIGGVVFGNLKNLRTTDYTFDWEEVLNPKGFTGICCQYAHARCCSVLAKGGGAQKPAEVTLSLLTSPEEQTLIKDLGRLPSAVVAAAQELEPSRLARAVYDVARSWNRFQQAGQQDQGLRILCTDEPTRSARLVLVDAVRIGLRQGLDLLGVRVPSAM